MFSKISLIFLIATAAFVNAGSTINTTKFFSDQIGFTLSYEAHAGYQQIDWYYPAAKSGMFYQFYSAYGKNPKKEDPDTPLMIWLQGGPGASSQFGAFTELGPIKYTKGKIGSNPWAWNLAGHLLFIDSPLNVGFSYSGEDRNGVKQVNSTDQATNHLVNFLVNFYNTWPELKQSPLYITGESFAGHYIPVLARKLLTNNSLITKNLTAKVAGVSIGDGWTDPINQINYYDTYLWSVGVVDKNFRDTCTWFQTNGIVNMYENRYTAATAYFDFLTNNDTTPQAYMGGISMFNFRNYNGLDESFVTWFESNKAQFGVKADIKYIPGNDFIYTAFQDDVTRSVTRDLVEVIRRVKTLIYNGQEDVVVNTPGVLQYLNSLNWENLWVWKRAPKQVWKINEEVTGWAKVYGNLWFVLVNKAGHMVPTDQPRAAFSMLGRFINGVNDWS